MTEENEIHVEEQLEDTEAEDEGDEESEESPAVEVKSAPSSSELKVVIVMKADSVMIGAQSPDCDPVYRVLKGDLAAALEQVPSLVGEAREKWNTAPKYPKANLPTPPPSNTPTRSQPAKAASKPKQPSFF